ncbi:MAG: hypothetical protein HYY18_14670 [Planctomycetes bacterium]|nr:hypothetical protein [Planctomycetota bacterium]
MRLAWAGMLLLALGASAQDPADPEKPRGSGRTAEEILEEWSGILRKGARGPDWARLDALQEELVAGGAANREAIRSFQRGLNQEESGTLGHYCDYLLRGIDLTEKIERNDGDLVANLVLRHFESTLTGAEFRRYTEIDGKRIGAALQGLRVLEMGVHACNTILLACDPAARRVFYFSSLADAKGYLKPAKTLDEARAASVQLVNLLGCLDGPHLTEFSEESFKAVKAGKGITVSAIQVIRYHDDGGDQDSEDEWTLEFDEQGVCTKMEAVRRHKHFYAEK